MNLEDVFKMQHELNLRSHAGYKHMLELPKESNTFAQAFSQFTLALTQEIAETTDTLNWKWWKQHKGVDINDTKSELVDEFHFFVSRCLLVGMTAEDLLVRYFWKNQINHERQDNGY